MGVLEKAYVGYVRRAIEYGIATWGNAAKSNFQKVEAIQNRSLRIITGGMRSTPINHMESTTGLHTMQDRRDIKTVTQYAKFHHIEAHPMHYRVKQGEKSRIKRTNFCTAAKTLTNAYNIPNLEPHSRMELTYP